MLAERCRFCFRYVVFNHVMEGKKMYEVCPECGQKNNELSEEVDID